MVHLYNNVGEAQVIHLGLMQRRGTELEHKGTVLLYI